MCRDSCLLCCRSVESPPRASRQGEAPAGPRSATPTDRPGRPVTQPLSCLSYHMDWQPCCNSYTLISSQHSTGVSLQSTNKGDSGQLHKGIGGLGAPLINSHSFCFMGGYVFESYICVFEILK